MDKVRKREEKRERSREQERKQKLTGIIPVKTRQPMKEPKVRPTFKNTLNQEIKIQSKIKADISESLLPSQVMIKLKGLGEEEIHPQMTINIETTRLDLNILMNKLKKTEETQSYIFLIDDVEIKENIKETVSRMKDFTSENVINIICHPESMFNVKPLTRASSTLEGHTDSILTVAFSPDGSGLVSGGGDLTIRFWDTFTETPMFSCEGHNSWILCVAWSPDGNMVASGSVSGEIMLWDPKTGICWKPMHLDKECIVMVTASKDGYFKIWNALLKICMLTVYAHKESITKIIWSGQNYIYTCSQDKTIKVWDETGLNTSTLAGHAHWINTMTLNTEYCLRTACFDEKNKSFNNKDEMHSYALERYNKLKSGLAKDSIEKFERLVSGSDDCTLMLWDPINCDKPLMRMTGHQGLVNHVQFSPDTIYLASASFDKSIRIWNGHTGKYLYTLRGHVAPIYQICWSPDSRLLLSGCKDSTLKVWNVKIKKLMFDLPGHADEVYCVDWSPTGEKAVSGSKDRMLRIWKN